MLSKIGIGTYILHVCLYRRELTATYCLRAAVQLPQGRPCPGCRPTLSRLRPLQSKLHTVSLLALQLIQSLSYPLSSIKYIHTIFQPFNFVTIANWSRIGHETPYFMNKEYSKNHLNVMVQLRIVYFCIYILFFLSLVLFSLLLSQLLNIKVLIIVIEMII